MRQCRALPRAADLLFAADLTDTHRSRHAQPRQCARTSSRCGSTGVCGWSTVAPLTETSPAKTSSSLARRDATPAAASTWRRVANNMSRTTHVVLRLHVMSTINSQVCRVCAAHAHMLLQWREGYALAQRTAMG